MKKVRQRSETGAKFTFNKTKNTDNLLDLRLPEPLYFSHSSE
jgi:hypothetical protein